MANHGVVDIHPEELEGTQDDGLRELGLFATAEEEAEAVGELGRWIHEELHRAHGARASLARVWEENLRMYEGISKLRHKSVPFENASNLEIPLGAIASDAIYAQIVNLIFNVDPLVTVRETAETGERSEHVKALQRFIDVCAKSRINLRSAAENSLLDNVQLGTGVVYIPWRERRKKTMVDVVSTRGPELRAIPTEDFFVPGGSCDDFQRERWCAVRSYFTGHEMNLRARDLGWNIEGIQAVGNIDHVRQIRERLGRHDGFSHRKADGDSEGGDIYEVYDIYCYYDFDGDGIDEDLLVTYDYGSKAVLKWRFNPYDKRPFESMRYQLRAHLFYGLGVIEMLRPFQEGATNLYNHWVDNSLLANCRFWVGKHGAFPNNQMRIWPNRFLPVQDPQSDINAIPMADTYPSAPAALQTTISFAERRTGSNELSGQGNASVLGTRTPGITALSMMQAANERFGPAFDGARMCITNAVKQFLFRYQERLLANDFDAETDIYRLLGEQRGALVVELLRDKSFDDTYTIELTSSSASVNKETDRQNWLLLVQQVVTIGERVMGLAQIIENPGMGMLVRETAKQLVGMANEILDRTLRTFDQVRDPSKFIIQLEEQIQQVEAQVPQVQLQQVAQALMQQGAQGGNSQMGAAPSGQAGPQG